MKSIIEQTETLDDLIRQLRKIDSKLHTGQFIDAWRDNRRIIAFLESHRLSLLQEGIYGVAEKPELSHIDKTDEDE